MKAPFLIQGFFFQDRQWLELGMGRHGEGVVALIKGALCRSLFSGVIYADNNRFCSLVGVMYDQYGESALSEVQLGETKFTFVKKYLNRQSTINYQFEREGAIWVGCYSGETVGVGGAKCLLTEAPLDLFEPSPPRPFRI